MQSTLLTSGAIVLTVLGLVARADELPREISSAACRMPPRVDGKLETDEWRDATHVAFELRMVRADPAGDEQRDCNLYVMNSARALYVALQVPDATLDESLSPLRIDAAILGFGNGPELRPNEDRLVVGPGIFRDKHTAAAGQDDVDDPRQDGRGGMTRENGVCTFEWAILLDSGDEQDVRLKLGESTRFNIGYLDGLQVPTSKTWLGGLYGAALNQTAAWGTLTLCADVVDDGGAAFRGPAWVDALFSPFDSSRPIRARLTESMLLANKDAPAGKALLAFPYRDPQGADREGLAAVYLPPTLEADPSAKIPLFFAAGYELDDVSALDYVRRGWAVVTPRALETNPLIRTANPDVALLHIARSWPFIDDTRVVIGGNSAGGWMTLLLAAETFPLAGAAPSVPPVNLGYNGAYFFRQKERVVTEPGKPQASTMPVLATVIEFLDGMRGVYGEDYGDETWMAQSPLAHVRTITAPVSVWFSTADVLVPIDQVGGDWVRPFEADQFPAGFTMDPTRLTEREAGRLRLLDVLEPDDYEIFKLPLAAQPGDAERAIELPVSGTKNWSIVIFDEGAPEAAKGHSKYSFQPLREEFLRRCMQGKVNSGQLTLPKLKRLMDRYAGKEWLPSKLVHLDFALAERADVTRGLKTYFAADPENVRVFLELYRQLPAEQRLLDAALVPNGE